MCGIIGVIGPEACEKAFSGLKALEYRGYDSWGIAAPSGNGGPFYVEKHVGKIGTARLGNHPNSRVALGHTRWATHGRVLEKNAHPHLSNDGKIAIVHNGIVENFSELKSELASKGFRFNSDTDSEVIANLIQLNSGGNSFEEAVRLSLLRLDGSYAVAAIRMAGEGGIVCARNGSPLVLGIGDGEFFVASDATAFISHTNRAVFLNDMEMAAASETAPLKVMEVATGRETKSAEKVLKWGVEQAAKGNYEHFMLKEIFEQPQALMAATEQPPGAIPNFVSLITNSEKVFLAGCGSSYHAAICGSYFFAGTAGVQAIPILASEHFPHRKFFGPKTLVIGISQSGETADLLECLKAAKASGSKVASIVNVMDSSVMRISDASMLMNAGPEICVLSTKSFTSQLAILLLISYALAGKEAEGKALIKRASELAADSLSSLEPAMKGLAGRLAGSNDIFVIGRQEAYPAALESALKIKEVSYIHAEGFAGAELKHGTIALIEEGTPAIVLSTPETRAQTLSNAIEMRSRGASIIGVDQAESGEYVETVQVPDAGAANPILLVLPIQLLSYYLALERGLDPDKPRNLAKSVTVK